MKNRPRQQQVTYTPTLPETYDLPVQDHRQQQAAISATTDCRTTSVVQEENTRVLMPKPGA